MAAVPTSSPMGGRPVTTGEPMPDLPESIRLEIGQGGLPVLRIDGPAARAEIYLHGATVTGWAPHGREPVLFVSSASRFSTDAAIRGGVPICFPWFGARSGHPESPPHGFARLSEWSLVGAHDDGQDVTVHLRLTGDSATGAATWPHPFEAVYAVVVGSRLKLALTVTNRGDTPMVFEEALHTYLAVRDIRSTEVTGLEGTPFHDSVAGPPPVPAASPSLPGEPGPVPGEPDPVAREPGPVPGEPVSVRFGAETDRVYLDDGASTVTVRDLEDGRSVLIGKDRSGTTVVWNPWIDKALRLPDLGDDEWTRMVCVEVSNIAEAAVSLAPGESHTMIATFAESL
jgi:glucose-6-phosphate 1-epimerase